MSKSVCCNTSRYSCQAVLGVQTGVYGWALWCNIKHPLTIVLCIFFELLASACHMFHMIKHCLLLSCLHNACVLVVVTKKITLLAVGCILNFILLEDCDVPNPYSGICPVDLSSGSTSRPQ